MSARTARSSTEILEVAPGDAASFDRHDARTVPLLVLLCAIGLVLRAAGADRLPWSSSEGTASRALALSIGAATAPLAFVLVRPAGRARAMALALLVATSPWHVHASRLAGPGSAAFLALLAAGAWIGSVLCGGRGVETRFSLGLLAAVAAIDLLARGGAASTPAARPGLVVLLAGDVGVALPLLALLGLLRSEPRSEHLFALLACSGCAAVAELRPGAIAPAAWLLPPLFLCAADELGRWLEAARSARASLALALLAVVPTLPALASEQIDGGRFDLAPIERAFSTTRRAGEPLYASDPALASRVLRVEARPLAELAGEAPAGRAAFVLLLIERGTALGGEALPADFESRLDLLARTARTRLDLNRLEARLYRRPSAP